MAAQLIILLLNPVIGLVLSLTFLGFWYYHRTQRHLATAAIGYGFSTLAFVTQGLTPQLPFELQRLPGNLLFLLSAAFIFAAVLRALRLTVPVAGFTLAIVAGMVALCVFLWVVPNLPARVVVLSVTLAAIALITALRITRHPRPRTADQFLFWVVLLASADFLMRPLLVLIFADGFVSDASLQQSFYWVWVQVFFAITAILVALGLFAVLSSDMVDELRREAETDKLSGLNNRRGFEKLARRALQRVRHPAAVTLVIADIDHFKRINDTFGHPVGDAVIASFGEYILARMPEGAVAGRIGGEEFAMLLPGVDTPEAEMLAQGLQEDLAQSAYQQFSGTLVPTASMGLVVGGSDADLSALLRTADQALYKAKYDGRNRTCILTLR